MARLRPTRDALVQALALAVLVLGALGIAGLMIGLPGQPETAASVVRTYFLAGTLSVACVLTLAIAALRPSRLEFLWFGAFTATMAARLVVSAPGGDLLFPGPEGLLICLGVLRAGSLASALLFVLRIVGQPAGRLLTMLFVGIGLSAVLTVLYPNAEAVAVLLKVVATGAGLAVAWLLVAGARRGVDGATALLLASAVLGGAAMLNLALARPVVSAGALQVVAMLVFGVTATGALLLRLSDGSDWFAVLATHARDAIVVATNRGDVVEANAAWDALLGRPATRQSVRDAVSVPDRALAEAHLTGREDGRRVELRLVNAQGGEVFAESVAVSLPEGRVLLVMRDITSRRQLESSVIRAARLETAGILAGGIAHDVNNAMTAMMAHVEMLRTVEDPRALKRLDRMETIIRRTAIMTRRLVTTMRGDSGPRGIISVSEPVQSAVELARSMLPAGVSLEVVVDEHLPQIHGSSDELEQAVINLLLNARDALADAGGRIAVQVSAGGAQQGVLIAVEDDGPGIPEALRTRIFEPFYTTKGPTRGTGLGLSVVARVVRDHGGALSITDAPGGHGARFEISLPPATSTPTLTSGLMAPHARVLAVDDDPDILEMMRAELQARGCEVVTAPDAEAAERAFDADAGRFDLLVTDVVLPAMSGVVLAQRLSARRPGLGVLIVSGYIPENEPSLNSRWGRLDKPFNAERLGTAVRRTMIRALRDTSPD